MNNYSKEEIKEFVQYYKEICGLDERLNDLTVGDVFVDENNRLVPKDLKAIKKYKKFDFNTKKIERKMSKL